MIMNLRLSNDLKTVKTIVRRKVFESGKGRG